ncbi:MAG: outer membrane beta-barrel protein [Acidobacteriota bacterium]
MKLFCTLALALFASTQLHGQAAPTATRTTIQAGGTFTFAAPDLLNQANTVNPYIEGYTIYADVGFARRFSVEAEYHGLTVLTPRDFGENSLLAGPRYSFALEDRANLYVKALGGLGNIVYQAPSFAAHTESHGVIAFGAGIEFRLTHHINLRPIDVEYQHWLSYPAGLNPFVTSIGAAWVY